MIDHSQQSRPRRFDREIDGIVLLDKSQGMSSNSALQQARVIFRALKAGHAGSLDPLATGMLPLCFGEATKVCAFLLDSRKSYRFVARLGQRTDTGDAEGTVTAEAPVPTLDVTQVRSVLTQFMGEQTQIPPMYSALKHQGERLYTLARRGESVERAARSIVIERLELVALSATDVEIDVRCSKGTYVRTLAEDIAQALGTLAHLTVLRRTQVDPFDAQRMHSLEELADLAAAGPEQLQQVLLPTDIALTGLEAVQLDTAAAASLRHGQAVRSGPSLPTGAQVRLYGTAADGAAVFMGVGEVQPGGLLHPKRLLAFRD